MLLMKILISITILENNLELHIVGHKNHNTLFFFSFFFLIFFLFLGPYLWHMEVPRIGVQLELQLPAYATATAASDPSHVCDPHHSSQQRPILNTLSPAKDQTQNLMIPSQIRFCYAMMGIPS